MYNAYQKKINRRIRPEIVIAIIIALLVSAVLIFVYIDLKRNPNAIDDSANLPVFSEFESSQEKFVLFETDQYSLELPETWIQVNNPQKRFTKEGISRGYSPERFQGVKKTDIGKNIEIYSGGDLPLTKFDKIVRVSPEGSMLSVGDLSPRCVTFEDLVDEEMGVPIETEFSGARFTCAMNSVTNVTGAFETVPEAGVFLKGEESQDQYLFIFTDDSSRPNNSTFQKILKSFKVK